MRSQRPSRRQVLVGAGAAALTIAMPSRAQTSPATTAGSRPAATTAVIYDDIYKAHLTGEGHPESPGRCDAIMDALGKSDLRDRVLFMKPRAATVEEIHLCHDADYVQIVRREAETGKAALATGDTTLSARSFDVALHAAGGLFAAVDAVFAGKVANAFCAVRPPGHHAGAARGMGFCLFNNIALAARYAQKQHKVGKVLIVDWDVHHGNGTQEIFYSDGSVLFFDTHQSPLYPGTGRATETGVGKGKGCIINCPFARGAGRKEILGAYREKLLPAVEQFKPELVLISAGFDSRKDDPLGGFTLTDADFADLTAMVLAIARTHAKSRVISTLEGGYSLQGLALAATAHVRALVEQRDPPDDGA